MKPRGMSRYSDIEVATRHIRTEKIFGSYSEAIAALLDTADISCPDDMGLPACREHALDLAGEILSGVRP